MTQGTNDTGRKLIPVANIGSTKKTRDPSGNLSGNLRNVL